jgi:membrane protease YdiL (CAAX protease family)
LGLYLVYYLLGWWGLQKEQISMPFNARRIVSAVAGSLAGWLIFVLTIQILGFVQLSQAFQVLINTPVEKIAMQILSTWFFVGLGEEVLFRGYFLKAFERHFTRGTGRQRTVTAVLWASAFFSLWHLPVRIFGLITGDLDLVLLLVSLVVLFLLGLGYSYLYIRSDNILLAGLVHGLSDFPLIGKETQMTPVILFAAILYVEIARRMARPKVAVRSQ